MGSRRGRARPARGTTRRDHDAGRAGTAATSADRLAAAQGAHREGRLDEAERAYRSVLDDDPDNGDALHFLGVLLHQRRDDASSVMLLRRAIENLPASPHPLNNLGNVLVEADRPDDAIAAFRACIAIDPGYARAHNNLATVLAGRGRVPEAETEYRLAIAADPGLIEAYSNLSNLLQSLGRTEEAAILASRAIICDPRDARSWRLLGAAYETVGDSEKAAEVYRQWIAAEPANPIARHHLAAVTGSDVPARASDAYVEATFDTFAASFDSNLQNLNYRAPELIRATIHHVFGEPAGNRSILDAGCGTGLCGPLVRPWASRLTGVDLSSGMLARARERRVYDELEKAELETWLVGTERRWDIILSADTLCYFGDLGPVVDAANRALGADGLFVFTLETLAPESSPGYELRAGGRYAHSRNGVEQTLDAAGFASVEIDDETLRLEAGRPVRGCVVRARHLP
jgi:predicted TPR repeat methyltransferase